MAKEKKTPAKKSEKTSTPKAEPSKKKASTAAAKKKVIAVDKPAAKKESTPSVKKTPAQKRVFPAKSSCTHEKTRRMLGPRNRVLHICVECEKVVRTGSR